jgi:hypothetical protein
MKRVFHAVAQAPVAAHAQARCWRPTGGFAQRLRGLGIAPAVHLGMGRLGADAGDFGKRLEQLGLHARASSSRCSRDQAGLACTVQRSTVSRPGLDDSRASQAMRWWVLRAAFHWGRGVVSPGLHGLRKGQHQRPAGGHLATATSCVVQRRVNGRRLTSSACAGVAGWPAAPRQSRHTHAVSHPCPWVRNCQWLARSGVALHARALGC